MLPCYSTATSGAANSAGARTVVRIDADGALDATTTFSGASSEAYRSVTTVDGSGYWLATTNGQKFVRHGNSGTAPVQLSASSGCSMRGSTIAAGAWWVVMASAPNTVGRLPLPLATTAGTYTLASIAVPGMLTGGFTSLTSVVVQNNATVFVSGTASGSLHKSVLDAATGVWASAAGFPKTTILFSPPGAATPVLSTTALRGMVGQVDPSTGAFTLFATTASASGANYLLAFRTDTETFRAIAAAPANVDLRGAFPVPLRPTPTPSATPSNSVGAEPSTSTTPSGTPSGTPTGSPQVCAPGQGAGGANGAVASDSIIVLRVGSGTAAVASGAGVREAFLEEVNPTTGARRQTWALPPGGGAAPGCVVGTSFTTEGYLGSAGDRSAVLVPCWSAAPNGSAVPASTWAKAAGRLTAAGVLDVAATWTDSSTILRSITALTAATPGSMLFAVGSQGVKGIALGSFGAASTPVTISTSMSARGSVAAFGRVWGAVIAGTGGVGSVPSLTAASQTWAYEAGLSPTFADMGSLAFESESVLWVLDYTPTANATFWRYEREAATGVWAVTAQTGPASWIWLGRPFTQAGGRGLAGVTDATNTFHLYYTSHPTAPGFAEGNFVLRFTPSLGVTEAVAQSCAFTEFRSVAVAPIFASPSASVTAPPSSTASATATSSGGISPSTSATATPSPSLSASPSSTGTPSNSPICGAPVVSGAPLDPSSVVLVRVGDGRTPLSATNLGAPVYVDELNPVTGALRQSIGPLPGCVMSSQYNTGARALRCQATAGASR